MVLAACVELNPITVSCIYCFLTTTRFVQLLISEYHCAPGRLLLTPNATNMKLLYAAIATHATAIYLHSLRSNLCVILECQCLLLPWIILTHNFWCHSFWLRVLFLLLFLLLNCGSIRTQCSGNHVINP